MSEVAGIFGIVASNLGYTGSRHVEFGDAVSIFMLHHSYSTTHGFISNPKNGEPRYVEEEYVQFTVFLLAAPCIVHYCSVSYILSSIIRQYNLIRKGLASINCAALLTACWSSGSHPVFHTHDI